MMERETQIESQLLSTRQAADMLGSGQKFVRNLIRQGVLRVLMISTKNWKVLRSEVEAYIERNAKRVGKSEGDN